MEKFIDSLPDDYVDTMYRSPSLKDQYTIYRKRLEGKIFYSSERNKYEIGRLIYELTGHHIRRRHSPSEA